MLCSANCLRVSFCPHMGAEGTHLPVLYAWSAPLLSSAGCARLSQTAGVPGDPAHIWELTGWGGRHTERVAVRGSRSAGQSSGQEGDLEDHPLLLGGHRDPGLARAPHDGHQHHQGDAHQLRYALAAARGPPRLESVELAPAVP